MNHLRTSSRSRKSELVDRGDCLEDRDVKHKTRSTKKLKSSKKTCDDQGYINITSDLIVSLVIEDLCNDAVDKAIKKGTTLLLDEH